MLTKIKYSIRLIVCLGLLAPLVAHAEKFELDLNGFRLWQYKAGVRDYFGKAPKTIEGGRFDIDVHWINKTSFMAFEYLKKDYQENVYAIQITGYPTKMLPFKGLKLGDPAARVDKVLGVPDKTEAVKGTPYIVNYYDKHNYSTEYDADKNLYSIKLHITKEFMDRTNKTLAVWDRFKNAVAARDMQAILATLRPDMEIYKDGKTLSIKKRYYDFVQQPDQTVVDALLANENSVRASLAEGEPVGEIRLVERLGVGQVFKFYQSKIMHEIVLFPYDGEYRVYEIAFRKADSAK